MMALYRNIILLVVSVLFTATISILTNYLYDDKIREIAKLKKQQKDTNEKFITAQILSKKLKKVYTLFKTNLAIDKTDVKNKEANMLFLKDLTDIIEKLNIKLLQIEPGSKKKDGMLTYIPYDLQIQCDYERLGKFITALEGNDRLITVDEIKIKNGTEKIKAGSQSLNEITDMNITLTVNTITINKAKK